MRNLFDIGLEFFENSHALSELISINHNTSFPLLPINIQQETQKLIKLHRSQKKTSEELWTGTKEDLNAFTSYLRLHYPVLEDSSSISFIRRVASLLSDLEKESKKHVREAMRGADLNPNDYTEFTEMPAPKKRARKTGRS